MTVHWNAIKGATQIRMYLQADPRSEKLLLATLPSASTSYKATGLAPAATVFLRMEANKVSQDWTVRTAGGPRAALDNPVREIHACAPDVLQVTLSGGNGPAWQSGKWTVTRANGAEIAVRSVYRDSVAVGAPDYEIGYGKRYRDDVLDVDHRLYLVLAEPIGSVDILRIRGPQGISVLLPFNDRYLETPAIHLNQAGYNPHATKRYAYISGWMGDGGGLSLTRFPSTAEILQDDSRAVIGTAPITKRSAMDSEAGSEVKQIDLSAVAPAEKTGFRLRIPGVGVSWPTSVSQSAAFHAYYIVTRGLFHNRWGGDLKPQYTEWSRPPDYHHVYTGELADFTKLFPADTPRTAERRLTGGYHDAGDFEQRPMSTVVPQLLMRALDLNAKPFTDSQLNIPESGNGIPDLLDEALWGVVPWEQLQESDGGVRLGVQSHRHPWGFYLASDDPLPYWTFSRDANTTARAAGIFAQAARLVAPYDRARAEELKQRAVKAWSYAEANAAGNAQRLYAAGELYRLTRQQIYKDAFERVWHAVGPYGAFGDFAPYQLSQSDYRAGKRSMPDYVQGYIAAASPAAEIKTMAGAWFTKYADEAVKRMESEHAYRNPRPANYPMDWGQGTTMVRFLDTVIARLQLGGLSPQQKQQYFDALSLAADYVLGANPSGLVYITGLGSRPVEEPLHLDSLVFIKQGKGPLPGIPVFGPTAAAPKAAYTLPVVEAFYPAFARRPEAFRYADVRSVPNFNEFSVWETQAPDVELFAILWGAPL
ncbi:conserved hypothetical protein [Candidatus Sulfopaludibacter sp. SbA6]|nr:conserved hypothetical protein [Candidatus Sulfopaludibacter sp. SbA6]